MPNWYMQIDEYPGLTLPSGRIVRMSRDQSAVEDATYTGNRLATFDDTAAGWNNGCIPGWFLNGSAVQERYSEGLAGLRDAFRTLHQQLHNWADGLDRLARGQAAATVAIGHDFLFRAHQAAYLIGRNSTTYTIAQRVAWANAMATGAADVTSPAEFYQHVLDDGITGPTGPTAWVNPADATKLNLSASQTISGTVPTTAELASGNWIEALSA